MPLQLFHCGNIAVMMQATLERLHACRGGRQYVCGHTQTGGIYGEGILFGKGFTPDLYSCFLQLHHYTGNKKAHIREAGAVGMLRLQPWHCFVFEVVGQVPEKPVLVHIIELL